MLSQTIGFVGAGQMARALASGFVAANLVDAARILASDPLPAAKEQFCRLIPKARAVDDNARLATEAEIIFLAVKPQQVASALAEIKGHAGGDKLLVSIAAGVRLKTLADALGGGPRGAPRLVRVMPNTPCLIGQSASAYCLGPGATAADGELIARLMAAVGRAVLLDEKLLDAVTGLSGSGPAFVYVMIEALSDGGVRMGLPREIATALAAQTVKGAAEMVQITGDHPAVLKDRVASPGGTTIAGLAALEAGGLRAALIAAVEAATRRSAELGGSRAGSQPPSGGGNASSQRRGSLPRR